MSESIIYVGGTASWGLDNLIISDLGWIKLVWCSCGNKYWQQTELIKNTCHKCGDECLMK